MAIKSDANRKLRRLGRNSLTRIILATHDLLNLLESHLRAAGVEVASIDLGMTNMNINNLLSDTINSGDRMIAVRANKLGSDDPDPELMPLVIQLFLQTGRYRKKLNASPDAGGITARQTDIDAVKAQIDDISAAPDLVTFKSAISDYKDLIDKKLEPSA